MPTYYIIYWKKKDKLAKLAKRQTLKEARALREDLEKRGFQARIGRKYGKN